MPYYRRRLPHIQPEGKPLFVTWHLHGSMPHNRFPPPASLSAGRAFVWMDRYLDQATFGPTWLSRVEIARIVVDSLHAAEQKLRYCDVHAYVVMTNHVHVLWLPHVPASKLLQSVKGFSARQANKLLGRTGEAFWQSESYDHWVRNDAEFAKIERYIEENPVRAGLVGRAEDYPWSSAYDGRNAGVAG
jgi:type I restriction enzyme R subunit/putative DNA methylase